MPQTRTPEEIRASIERNREDLATSIVTLRSEVVQLTDWRQQIRDRQQQVNLAAAAAGFVLGGGVAGLVGLSRRGRWRPRRPALAHRTPVAGRGAELCPGRVA